MGKPKARTKRKKQAPLTIEQKAAQSREERINFYRRFHGLAMHEAVEAVEQYDLMVKKIKEHDMRVGASK